MTRVLTAARRRNALLFLNVALLIAAGFAMLVGPDGLSTSVELMPLRASRILLAAMVGAGLAATGAALQALLQNPLADPYVIGVSGGAAFGGTLAIVVSSGVLGTALQGLGLHASAAAGAAAASALLAWFLARDRSGRSETALLVGVTLNAFAWALVAVVRAALPTDDTQVLSVWLVGSVGYPRATDLILAASASTVGLGLLVRASGDLALVRAGEVEAARLGVDLRRVKLLAYGAASLLVGVAVSTTGVIGFVGLMAPHAVRLVVGRDERVVIPASALAGAFTLVVFDAGARAAFAWFSSELPTGALTAAVGAPLFALALWRRVTAGGHR